MSNKQTGNNGCRGKAGPGRPKGSPNKVSGILKDAILLAAENAGNEDGGNGLSVLPSRKQAVEHPTAFMTLLGKVLPMQVSAEVENKSPPATPDNRQMARAVLQLIHRAQTERD